MGISTDRVTHNEALERLFESKRANFLDDYQLQSRPAMVWQCWPVEALALDFSNANIREAMSNGGGPSADDGWWYGFKMNGRPTLVFDGLASTRDHSSAGWATELHADGNFVAGVWAFPELGSRSAAPGPGVADFYVNAFRDFTFMVSEVYEAAPYSGILQLTATMHQANRLRLLGNPDRVLAPAPSRRTLRWPIAVVNTAELAGAGMVMAAQFMRIYGRSAPKP